MISAFRKNSSSRLGGSFFNQKSLAVDTEHNGLRQAGEAEGAPRVSGPRKHRSTDGGGDTGDAPKAWPFPK